VKTTCPICERHPAKRFCPAKGESICPVCCGTEREVTIDCSSDCPHLVAGRRYEAEHRKPIAPDQVAYPDVQFPVELVHERRTLISGLSYSTLQFAAANPSLHDADALTALHALAETYRTLGTGIYYERPPEAPLGQALYEHLGKFLEEFKKKDAERTGFSSLKDSEVFKVVVFLLRVGQHETNGRLRTRAFLDFLRGQFPKAEATQPESPRIVLP
jgi:hypothetical protein